MGDQHVGAIYLFIVFFRAILPLFKYIYCIIGFPFDHLSLNPCGHHQMVSCLTLSIA